MRQSFKVSFYLRSNYENKEGKSPVMLRIFLGCRTFKNEVQQCIRFFIGSNL